MSWASADRKLGGLNPQRLASDARVLHTYAYIPRSYIYTYAYIPRSQHTHTHTPTTPTCPRPRLAGCVGRRGGHSRRSTNRSIDQSISQIKLRPVTNHDADAPSCSRLPPPQARRPAGLLQRGPCGFGVCFDGWTGRLIARRAGQRTIDRSARRFAACCVLLSSFAFGCGRV